MEIILDTSSIVFGFSNNMDIFDSLSQDLQYKPLISTAILDELEILGKSRKRDGKFAKIALLSMKRRNIEAQKSTLPVDKWIIETSKERKCVVCTNDSRLKRILVSRGIKAVSFTRDGKFR